MKDDKLKSYLHERLDGYSHPVGDDIWLSIRQDARRKKRSKRRVLSALSMGAAAVVLALIIFPPHRNNSTDIPMTFASESPIKEDNKPVTILEVDESDIIIADVVKTERENMKASNISINAGIAANMEKKETGVSGITKKEIGNNQPEQKKEPAPQSEPPTSKVSNSSNQHFYPNSLPRRRNKQQTGLSLLLAVNGSGSPSGDSENRSIESSLGNGIFAGDGSPVNFSNPDFDFPTNVGLTIRKHLVNGFALESGLNYTFLRTRGEDAEIKLHYLGIPIKGVYTFNPGRRVTFYGSLGGAVERQIYGELISPRGNTRLRNSNLQWSARLSAGVDVKLGGRIGLYAEPGVSYFFDDGSNIPTIRKEKPLNFNFQVGLRLNID